MKYKVITLVLILLLSLSACGEKEQGQELQKETKNEERLKLVDANDPAWLMKAKIEQAVLGVKREEILSTWGEADGMLSGLFGDIFNLVDGWYTILYYSGYEDGVEYAVVSEIKIRNWDENVPLHQSYTYPMISEWSWFSSPGVLLDAENGSFSMSFSPISSYMPAGDYKVEEDTLILKTRDGKYQYYFTIDGENLIFDATSSSITWHADIPDGAAYEPDMDKTMKIQETKQNFNEEIKEESKEENNFGGYGDYQIFLREKRGGNLTDGK